MGYVWKRRIVWISSRSAWSLSSSIFTRLHEGADEHAMRESVSTMDAPGDDAFGFLRVDRAQVCDLCSLELRQGWFSS